MPECAVCHGSRWVEAAPVGTVMQIGWDCQDKAPLWQAKVTVPCFACFGRTAYTAPEPVDRYTQDTEAGAIG